MEAVDASGGISAAYLTIMFWRLNRARLAEGKGGYTSSLEHPEIAQMLAQFGHFPERSAQIQQSLRSLKSSVATEIPDFPAFRVAVEHAVAEMRSFGGTCPDSDRRLLDEVAQVANNPSQVLSLLNRNPLGECLPFVERVPIKKGNDTVWVAPIHSAVLVKRPKDSDRFLGELAEVEKHFVRPHPAIDDAARVRVIDAIARVSRELSRKKPYLPGALGQLELRIAEYQNAPIEPSAARLSQTLVAVLKVLDSGCVEDLPDAAETYLREPALRSAWLTDRLVGRLLAPAAVKSGRWRFSGTERMLDLVRREIASDHYDKTEMIRRLRHLEQSGVYFSTFVYALLQTFLRDNVASPVREFEVKSGYKRQAAQGGDRV